MFFLLRLTMNDGKKFSLVRVSEVKMKLPCQRIDPQGDDYERWQRIALKGQFTSAQWQRPGLTTVTPPRAAPKGQLNSAQWQRPG